MGRFDRSRPQHHQVRQPATPGEADLDHAPEDHGGHSRFAVVRPVQLLLAIGIDGQGPLASAAELADAARSSSPTTEDAVAKVARTADIRGAAGGFITGVGGFYAMPVAWPLNVVEFYAQAARMVSAIAILRGHDVADSEVRKAVLHTVVGTQQESVLVKAFSATRGGAMIWQGLRLLPAGVRLFASRALGLRVLRALVERLSGRLGRGVPLVGGVLVAASDGWMMRRVAKRAMHDFPAVDSAPPAG